MDERRFKNRNEAGRRLAERLVRYRGSEKAMVLGLPRGGVVVAAEVARALSLPLDVFIVRKLGAPGQEELAMGAIASGGVRVVNWSVVDAIRASRSDVERVADQESRVIEQRERLYRPGRGAIEVKGKTVIIVDDGLATGATMRVAVLALRRMQPRRLVMAVPLASPDVCAEFAQETDEAVCLETPDPFYAVGAWYEEFTQVEDEEVCRLLATSADAAPR